MQILVHHIDDAKTAQVILQRMIKSILPNANVVAYSSGPDYVAEMTQNPVVPWMLLLDWQMPMMTGYDILQWIRRNPSLHHTPVAMVSAELDEATRGPLEIMRPFGFVTKPVELESLRALFDRRKEIEFPIDQLRQLDLDLANESTRALSRILGDIKGAPTLDDPMLKSLYFCLHTIKGDTASLHFPAISVFSHQMEEIIEQMKRVRKLDPATGKVLLVKGIEYLIGAFGKIRDNQIFEVVSAQFSREIDTYIVQAQLGSEEATSPINEFQEFQKQSDDGVHLSTDQVLTLQEDIKKVLRATVQLTSEVQAIKKWAPDAEFLTALHSKISTLNLTELDLFSNLARILSIPENKLQTFLEKTSRETAASLGKRINLFCEIEKGFELDPITYQHFRFSMTHLIRNALDHGIEPLEERRQAGKPETAYLRFALRSKRKNQVEISIEDDGRGLDPELFRRTAIAKGISNASQAQGLSPDEAISLIFHDGFSTKSEANAISGRGVGLAHVRQIIESNDGQIEVFSEVGKFTRFRLTLTRALRLLG